MLCSAGKVFLDFKSELEDVYKIYCQNHDDAITLLGTYEKDENIQRHVLECLEKLRWLALKAARSLEMIGFRTVSLELELLAWEWLASETLSQEDLVCFLSL